MVEGPQDLHEGGQEEVMLLTLSVSLIYLREVAASAVKERQGQEKRRSRRVWEASKAGQHHWFG